MGDYFYQYFMLLCDEALASSVTAFGGPLRRLARCIDKISIKIKNTLNMRVPYVLFRRAIVAGRNERASPFDRHDDNRTNFALGAFGTQKGHHPFEFGTFRVHVTLALETKSLPGNGINDVNLSAWALQKIGNSARRTHIFIPAPMSI